MEITHTPDLTITPQCVIAHRLCFCPSVWEKILTVTRVLFQILQYLNRL